jgi:hypothetical protein
MQKKDLSKTYKKPTSVKQTIDTLSRGPSMPLARPVSAGGASAMPATLSQEYLQFVDGIDEVPEWIRAKVWAVITRMNNLTYIDGDFDFERLSHGVRAILRAMMWDDEISLQDMTEIEYYVGVQLRRSKLGKERRYIAPNYSQIVHQESASNDTVIDERQQGNSAMGLLNKNKQNRWH